MKIKFSFRKNAISILYLVTIFTINSALAESDSCQKLQNTAKVTTINGQTDIPRDTYVFANKNRVMFYNAPNELCKINDIFVVNGDLLYAYKKFLTYTYVSYPTIKGQYVFGWVNSDDIDAFSPEKAVRNKKRLFITDFIVMNDSNWFGLGSNYEILGVKENEISSSFIGDFPNNVGGLDKFYAHEYTNFSIIESNVGYDKRLWTMDDSNIISSITLKTPNYKTIRNIKVGDSANDIRSAYNLLPDKENSNKIGYLFSEMSLVFNLNKEKITSIEMSFITDN
ncbi:hypothetical protein CWS43_21135 [Rahnella sp. AA]|uniref:hypothetical protein n=1 Tax=Rahnella sp. AA TaxID=2057180 RepID=UPI000C32CA8F|nr:hypothetical protein [Rahnella sp. AA]PKE28538.1 hypothetical protein CWS43_21135 [Rahnella sp. AA]